MARRPFTRAQARQTSILTFRHIDGTEHGGACGGTTPETFSVVSHPRYGDTKPRRFRYDEVAEVLRADARNPVPLATFSRLMSGDR